MRPLRNPEIQTTLLPDGHVVLFSTKTDWAHTLNPVGAIVWEFCDGQHEAAHIVDEVVLLTGSDHAGQINGEVAALLDELTAKGLITLSGVECG